MMYALKQMQTPLWSFIVLCLLHRAGTGKLQIKEEDACPGNTLTFECIVNGDKGDSTVWQGSAFSGCVNNEIVLLHNRFGKGAAVVECKNRAIVVQSIRVESNSISSNESLYISQLVVVVQPEMIGSNIECINDDIDASQSNKIGNISLISTLCNVSQNLNNDTGHVILKSKDSKLSIGISSSIVLLFVLLLSGTLIFLLHGHRKKLWSTLLSLVCNTGRGMSQDCHVINNNDMEVVKTVDNEKMGIYNQSLNNFEVQKAENIITNAEQGQVSSQWYSFGLAIGVPKQILNQLKHRDEECLVEVLDYWLRHHPGKPTWQEIMEARNKLIQSA